MLDEQTALRLAEYARNIWEISESDDIIAAQTAIMKTADFFKSMNLASSLKEIGVEKECLVEMAKKATSQGPLGAFRKLEYQDVLNILQAAYDGSPYNGLVDN
mgnify:CR=1 FL=1